MFIDKIFTCVMYRQQEHQVIVTYTYVYSHTGKYILVYNTIQLHVCTPNYTKLPVSPRIISIGFINQRLLQHNVQKTSINYNLVTM